MLYHQDLHRANAFRSATHVAQALAQGTLVDGLHCPQTYGGIIIQPPLAGSVYLHLNLMAPFTISRTDRRSVAVTPSLSLVPHRIRQILLTRETYKCRGPSHTSLARHRRLQTARPTMKLTLPLTLLALLASAHSTAAYCCFSSTGLCARAAAEPHLVRRAGETGFDARACCCTAANYNLCASNCVCLLLEPLLGKRADGSLRSDSKMSSML